MHCHWQLPNSAADGTNTLCVLRHVSAVWLWNALPNIVWLSFIVVAGQPLVLEVDGPYHYRRPDNAMTGTTRYRNRALAARGYTVVTIPW